MLFAHCGRRFDCDHCNETTRHLSISTNNTVHSETSSLAMGNNKGMRAAFKSSKYTSRCCHGTIKINIKLSAFMVTDAKYSVGHSGANLPQTPNKIANEVTGLCSFLPFRSLKDFNVAALESVLCFRKCRLHSNKHCTSINCQVCHPLETDKHLLASKCLYFPVEKKMGDNCNYWPSLALLFSSAKLCWELIC